MMVQVQRIKTSIFCKSEAVLKQSSFFVGGRSGTPARREASGRLARPVVDPKSKKIQKLFKSIDIFWKLAYNIFVS